MNIKYILSLLPAKNKKKKFRGCNNSMGCFCTGECMEEIKENDLNIDYMLKYTQTKAIDNIKGQN